MGVNLVLVNQSELPFDTHFPFAILVKTMHLDSTPLCIQNEVNLVTAVDRVPVHAIPCTTALHVDQEGALLFVHTNFVNRQVSICMINTLDDFQDSSTTTAMFTQLEG